ncbi:hypothetical protein DE146DRAFT_640802 [Phaeosphaeria sp. MPI-PUGE-AT-0046c]|nr:hypothetical protein DE146DRAFT_640802 [Phaeosphaeria sp. MPI-PUGE-AT-0046c]
MPIGMVTAPQHDNYYRYLNPDKVRHLYSLYDLLPLIDPMRRFNHHNSQMLDIIEEGTGKVLYYAVPKRLLLLFLGRNTVYRLLVSPYPRHSPSLQQLVMPRGRSSKPAWTILISWMKRATQETYACDLKQLKVPHNILAACTLAQTLYFVGLHKDAYRVDMTIARDHFVRPMYAAELEPLWINLGPENRYTRAAMITAKQQLDENSFVRRKMPWMCDDIMKLLEVHPGMKATVLDKDSEHQISSPREVHGDVLRKR